MVYIRLLFNGLVLGLLTGLVMRQSTWLEMRVPTGLFIPLGVVIVFLLYFLGKNRLRWVHFTRKTTLITTIFSSVVMLVLYGGKRLTVVPASMVRELFNHPEWSFSVINKFLLVLYLGLFIFVMISPYLIKEREFTFEPRKEKKMDKTQKKKMLAAGLSIALLVLAYFLIPPFRNFINTISSMLVKLDISGLRDYIKSFGMWGPLISIFLMMFQSVAAPLPAFVITFANAYVFGWAFGAFISWTGAMFGAILCFYIAKFMGRPIVEKLVSTKALNKMDGFFEDYGNYTILILRLIPFISFDVVSYAAGLTGMNLISFLVATGVGQLPATLVYSYVGGNLGAGTQKLLYALIGFCLLIAFSMLMKKILMKKKEKKGNYDGGN